MRILAVFAFLGAGVACAAEPPPPSTREQPVKPIIETIDETTVGDLDGVPVPMGNMTHMDYTLPDGTTRHGLVCSLPISGRVGVFVGKDSIVDVEGTRWLVLSIEKAPGELGSVTLKKLDD